MSLSSLFGVMEMGTLRFLFVTGQRLLPAASLRSNDTRSHVVPVARITGSRITRPEMGQINRGGAFPSMAIRSSSRIGVVWLCVGGLPRSPTDLAVRDLAEDPLPFREVPRGVRLGDFRGEEGTLLPYFSVVVTIPSPTTGDWRSADSSKLMELSSRKLISWDRVAAVNDSETTAPAESM